VTQLKLLTLLLALVAIVIFYLQNQLSIALIFYGITIPIKFPVGVWALLSLLAGIITSVILQFLSGFGRTRSAVKEKIQVTESYRSDRTTANKNNNSQNRRSQKLENKPLERPQQKEIDWDDPQSKKVDWDGREIKSEPSWTREIKEDFPFRKQPNTDSNEKKDRDGNYEVENKVVSENRSGSFYSYSYGEDGDRGEKTVKEKKTEPRNVDRVYDADYRVIDAPNNTPTDDNYPKNSSSENDEDWI
jgi:uncharacterized integral membrane protein